MRWFKRDRWKASIALAGMLLLLILTVWVPVSAAGAYERALGLATPGTVQVTPTEDATVTALNKEKLAQEVQQLKNQNDLSILAWFRNSGGLFGTVIAALFAVVGVLVTVVFNFRQWARSQKIEHAKELEDRKEAQEKELRDRAEERFKTAVTALGDEKEGTQLGGAILLRSFLNKDDEKTYGRYYTQIFDLAVAYLRRGPSDPRKNPLRQALIMVFKEAFPLAREKLSKEQGTQFNPSILDASRIQLDYASFRGADLKQIWMPWASLQKAILFEADLTEARLKGTDLTGATLKDALSLEKTDLREVKGLTKEQLEAYKKERGARIDEDTATSSPQSPVAPPGP